MELRNQDKETSMGSYNHHQLNLQEETHGPVRDPDPIGRATAGLANAAAIPTPLGTVSRSSPPLQPPPATNITPSPSVRYKECVRNHAASMGGQVVDGCGEFMPRGEEGTPEALICAACECHRNFHRREVDGESQHITIYYNNGQRNLLPSPLQQPNSLPLPHHHYHHHHQRYSHGVSMGTTPTITPPTTMPGAPVMVSFGGGAAAESSSEDLIIYQSNLHIQGSAQESKKRFRTKFTHQQKEKMMEFAEKLGWRIQKQDEQEVQQFCNQVGVKRKVFKVWMHNNKQTMKKKQT